MLSSLLWMLLAQMACTPGETSLVCGCKQGMVTACVALAGEDSRKAAQVLEQVQDILEQTSWMAEDQGRKQQLQTVQETLAHSLGEADPPPCKGQNHHLISRRIARALEDHPTLRGLFKPRDARLVSHAKDEQSHCGYQDWHRQMDKEVTDWLKSHPKATLEEFIQKLREIYSRPDMKARFPHGF
ncbi:MAG: Wall-associated protein precursor [Cystobacter sp.]